MPLSATEVGKRRPPFTQDVDARWLMSYAAGLGDALDCYLDTCREGGIVAHPAFPVAVEWKPILAQRHAADFPGAMTFPELARGVHSAHDLHLHRPIVPGDRLTTEVEQAGAFATRAGAVAVTRLETRDATGEPVSTTYMQNLYRGVALEGDPAWSVTPPPLPDFSAADAVAYRMPIRVRAEEAHVYTECARIWAPIHTDRAVALAAGLPDIILHGTCTLALAVSRVIERFVGDPRRVTRLGCRFTGMVRMPSTVMLHVDREADDGVSFEARNEDGRPALQAGYVCWTHDESRERGGT